MKATIVAGLVATLVAPSAIQAQTRSVRDTATAYGARLTAEGQPAALNQQRVNDRISNRVNSRLALRIERYRPESATDPTAAFSAKQDDKTHAAPIITPPVSDDPK